MPKNTALLLHVLLTPHPKKTKKKVFLLPASRPGAPHPTAEEISSGFTSPKRARAFWPRFGTMPVLRGANGFHKEKTVCLCFFWGGGSFFLFFVGFCLLFLLEVLKLNNILFKGSSWEFIRIFLYLFVFGCFWLVCLCVFWLYLGPYYIGLLLR